MCLAPITLPNGFKTSCHECWQCVARSVDDWVGRCIAETKTATQTFAVTLTYGRNKAGDVDHPHSALLIYSDVQKYLKLLRRHGYTVRYLVAGEYGERKGRAHWHMILFFYGKVPHYKLDQNFMEEHWPHGFSWWSKPEHHAIRYVCKYVQKDLNNPQHQGKLAMSKLPPLGAPFFKETAQRYVDAGLSPQNLDYRFPGVTRNRTDENGVLYQEPVTFRLRNKMAELYCEYYIAAWRAKHNNNHWPQSYLIDPFHEWGHVVNEDNWFDLDRSDVVANNNMAQRLLDAEKNPTVTDAQRAAARRRKPSPENSTGWPYNDPEWISGYVDRQQEGQHLSREARARNARSAQHDSAEQDAERAAIVQSGLTREGYERRKAANRLCAEGSKPEPGGD